MSDPVCSDGSATLLSVGFRARRAARLLEDKPGRFEKVKSKGKQWFLDVYDGCFGLECEWKCQDVC